MTMSDSEYRSGAPVTALLAAAVLGVYGLERVTDGQALCERFGLIPAHPSFKAALTSLFLHDPSSLSHVAGNLAFLVVFGLIVEPAIGSLRFASLFAAAGLGGAALHVFVDPSATTPLVGCSGALYGLLALAGVLRPRLLGFVFAFVGINVFHAIAGGAGTVSFGAHLGGFVVGAIVAVWMRVVGSEELEVA